MKNFLHTFGLYLNVNADFPKILYKIDDNRREKALVWRLLRPWHAVQLCNDTHKWFAVNIPLDIADPRIGIKGDIDLLVAMGVPEIKENVLDIRTVYRAFEVKTIKIERDGKVKSLKRNQIVKYTKQLEKIRDLGVNQTFLLEAYILEPGNKNIPNNYMSEVDDFTRIKRKELLDRNCGYASYIIEDGVDGKEVFRPIVNICPTKEFPLSEPFAKIAKYLDEFYAHNYLSIDRRNDGMGVMAYCMACKKVVLIGRKNDPVCKYCKKSLF